MICKIVPWLCFATTSIIFAFVWINAPNSIMVERPDVSLSFVLMFVTAFVNALILNVFSAYMKWVYIIATIVFAWMFSDLTYSYIHHNGMYLFGHWLSYNNFCAVPMVMLLANLFGITISLCVRFLFRKVQST